MFELTYTQLFGDDTQTTKVRSTGEPAFVTTGGRAYRVPSADLGPLRVSDDADGGISDFGIAGWVENPQARSAGATEVITGEVDAADMLSDLARIASDLGGDSGVSALDDDAGERLQRRVRSSSIKVVTGAKDRQLRSLRAVVDFGTKAPKELRRTLGRYADARIEVNLKVKQSTGDLQVVAPADFTTL